MTTPTPPADLTADLAEHTLDIGWTSEACACSCGWEPDDTLSEGDGEQYGEHLTAVIAARLAVREDKHAALVAGLTKALDDEIADVIESRVRSERGDVRCLDCGLRYAEREDYGCREPGRGHDDGYDSGLVDAEREARSEPVEYVTIEVAKFRALLTDADTDALAVRDAEVRAGALEDAVESMVDLLECSGDTRWKARLLDRARAERSRS